MDEDLKNLRKQLIRLHHQLRNDSKSKYNRINPFAEDLFDWKERGDYWAGAGNDVSIYNTTTIIGEVTIGAHTWIGPFCALDGSGSLSIGEYCSISSGVQIVTHDTVLWALSGGKIERQIAPVRVGNCCFIGSHAVITKGVSIGDHCLVAAGAVVTRDIPSFAIAAGVPAEIIGRVSFSEDGQIKLEHFSKSRSKEIP
jgi:acetyltransferase-like isoleucine patch superfamily enzyme